MKKIFFFLIIIVLAGCKGPIYLSKCDPKSDFFEIKKGQNFEIHFVSNASLGVQWRWQNASEVEIVDPVSTRYERRAPKDVVGAASDMYMKFKAVQTGTDTLIFQLYRPYDSTYPTKTVKKIVKVG